MPQTETPPLTLDPVEEAVSPDAESPTQQEPTTDAVSPQTEKISAHIVIPIAPKPTDEGYAGRQHLDLKLTRPQRDILRRITDGLVREEAEIDHGRVVKGPCDSIRWMLEEVGRRIENE